MAGETLKTSGIVLDIRPWSRTSHIVTWLTPDRGPVTTLVKGAVRPKSAFLGQYDFFYICELVYYIRAKGELHAIREVSPVDTREYMRGKFKSVALASYASYLVKEHCPHNSEAVEWYGFFNDFLASLDGEFDTMRKLADFEFKFLELAGLSPDFSEADFSQHTIPFSISLGRACAGGKTVQLPIGSAKYLAEGCRYDADSYSATDVSTAIRFLELFIRFHIDMPPDIRRNTLKLVGGGLKSLKV
ncbi:MAG: DNA repair protein RecO [Kiritimatiellae bacterium]|nr:DNA repair protein RecO [Kiritimatiellia bacterium]